MAQETSSPSQPICDRNDLERQKELLERCLLSTPPDACEELGDARSGDEQARSQGFEEGDRLGPASEIFDQNIRIKQDARGHGVQD
jgi:hypothetical protein